MKQILFFFLLILFISCQEKPIEEISEVKTETIISKSDISKLSFTDYILDKKSEQAVASWVKYPELKEIVDGILEGKFSYFNNNSEITNAFLKDLKSTLPESINTNAITARILTLETMFLKLQNDIKLDREKIKILKSTKAFLIANSNLKLQINKKFEKESQRIEKP